MEVNHIQGGNKIRLTQPQQFMAQDREVVEEAYAGILLVFLIQVYLVLVTP